MKTTIFKKSGILFLVSIIACLLMFVCNVDKSYADEAKKQVSIDWIIYDLYENDSGQCTASVHRCDDCSSEICLPSCIKFENKDYKLVSIGDCAFLNCPSLKEITIPDSVTSIGFCAFMECPSLSKISIPDSVTSIGKHAFQECSSLKEITFPASIKNIDEFAFHSSSLTEITFIGDKPQIGEEAFYSLSLNIICSWEKNIQDPHLGDAFQINYINPNLTVYGDCIHLTRGINIPDVTIELINKDNNQVVLTTKADKNGSYSFTNVPSGNYIIRACWQFQQFESHRFAMDGKKINVNVYFS